jgi:hypothetical protein
MNSVRYKSDHEAFVSNLKGTSAGDVIACLGHFPATIILIKMIQKTSIPLYLRDLVYLALPILLSMTILADYSYVSLIGIVVSEIVVLQMSKTNSIDSQLENASDNKKIDYLNKKLTFISLFKGIF